MRVIYINGNPKSIKAFSTYSEARKSFVEDFKKLSKNNDAKKIFEIVSKQKFKIENNIHVLKEIIVDDDVPKKVYIRCENNDINNIKIFWKLEDMPKALKDVQNNRVELVHII